MTDKTVTLRLQATKGNLGAVVGEVKKDVDEFGKAAKKAGDDASQGMAAAEAKTKATGVAAEAAQRHVRSLGDVARTAGTSASASLGQVAQRASGVSSAADVAKRALGSLGTAGRDAGNRVAEGLDNAGDSARRQIPLMQQLQDQVLGLVSIYGAMRLGAAFIVAADEATNLRSRIALVTETSEEAAQVQRELLSLAQETRSDLGATTTLYTRMASALKDVGASQTEVLGLTRTINQSFAVSGSSAAESEGAILQFSQALAAGALRGDEFNSVNEAGPRLMQALADALGVTRGELRGMAEDGLLTSDVMRSALASQAGVIAEEFSKMEVTVSGAMTQVRSAVLDGVGAFDQATGSTAFLADGLADIASVVSGLKPLMEGQTQAVKSSGDEYTVLGNVMRGFSIVGLLVKNTIEGVVSILAGSADIIDGFVLKGMAAVKFLVDATRASQELAKLNLAGAKAIMGEASATYATESAEAGKRIAAAYDAMADGVQNAVGDFKTGADTIATSSRASAAAVEVSSDAQDENAAAHKRAAQAALEAAKSTTASKTADEAAAVAKRELSAALADWSKLQAIYTKELYAQEVAEKEARDSRAERLAVVPLLIADMEDELNLMQLSGRELAIETALRKASADAAKLRNVELGISGQLTASETQRIRENAGALYDQGEAVAASREAATSFRQSWMSAVDSVSGALADFAVGRIKSFKDLGKSLLDIVKRMVADMIAQFLTMRVLGPIMNGIFGSIGGSLMGGVVNGAVGSAGGSALGGIGGGVLGALGGAYAGYQNPGNNGVASAARIGSYAVGGYVAGTIALGAVGGAAAAGAATAGAGLYAAGSAVAGGAAAGGMTAAAAIPVVGWIIAALALIDAVSGGKLFGTKYKPERVTQGLNLDAMGGTASTSLYETRQAALFGGERRRDRTIDSSDDAIAAAESLFDHIKGTIENAARQLTIDAPEVFDAAIRTVSKLDKKGKIKSSEIFVDILGRTWLEATEELAVTRLDAEALIMTIDEALAATQAAATAATANVIGDSIIDGINGAGVGVRTAVVDMMMDAVMLPEGDVGGVGAGPSPTAGGAANNIMGEASRIAERWRDNAEELLAGAQFLLMAVTDMRAGVGLLGDDGTLTQITDLIEELAYSGETLTATYQRVASAAALLDQALELSGVSIDGTREEIVRLAVDIAEAAGGIERAGQLWSAYFQRFYSEQERGLAGLDQVTTAGNTQFEDIGLNLSDYTGEGGMAAFRALFEERLPTLSAAAIADWLEAANALAAVTDAQAAYNAILAANEAALVEYNDFVRSIAEEIANSGLTEYQASMREVHQWTEATAAELNRLARAAGMSAAAEGDLAAMHQLAAIKAAQAMARLRESALDLVEQLYGTNLDRIEEQITAAEAQHQAQLDGISAVQDANQATYDAQIAAQQRIREYLDSMLLTDIAGLRPRDQLPEAQAQFQRMLEAALGGDAEAMSALPQMAQRLLEIGQSVYGSGGPQQDLLAFVRAALLQVAEMQIGAPGAPPGDGGGVITASPELQALYEERERLQAAQTAAERLALAQSLTAIIRDLVIATGDPLNEIAASLNLTMTDLIADLGINLDDLTSTTADQLATVAQQMGVNLSELADQVGVDLGDLADAQSLMNATLRTRIDALPEAERDLLRPLLADVEAAAARGDTAGVESGISAMEAAINALAPQLRDQLAPFFGGVTPVDYSQLDALAFIDTSTASAAASLEAHTSLLERIAANLAEVNAAAGLPSYEVGTSFVPRTGPALIHRGEMIVPAGVSSWMRKEGLPVPTGGSDNQSVLVEEIRLLREERRKDAAAMRAAIAALEAAAIAGANKQQTATREQTEVIKAKR